MQQKQNVLDCYNRTANNYAGKFMDELSHKHFDIMLLKAFAEENAGGRMIDLGCGPGQITRFLAGCGVHEITGTDISPEMIKVAKTINPLLHFETGDMLSLAYPGHSFDAAVAFYSIVHFTYDEIKKTFAEIKRVLKKRRAFSFLFSYWE